MELRRRRTSRARRPRDERLAVVRRAEHVLLAGHRREAVHVVEGAALAAVAVERRASRRAQRTSFQPMCGSFRPGAAARAPRPATTPGPSAPPCSLGALERQLHAQAEPEQRRARARRARAAARRGRARAGAPSPAGTRPRPGSTRPSAARSALRIAADAARARRRARAPSRPSGGCPCRSRRRPIVDRLVAALPHAVSVPFVLGTPVSVGSMRDRLAQRARERLERRLDHVVRVAARFHPQVQRELGGVGERAEELLGQLVLEAAGRAGRQLRLEQRERAAGDVDRAARARLVHRHDRRAVAGDPGAVAERLVERLAEHDRGVLGGVVRAGLEVAADRRRRGRAARGGRAGRACGRGSRRRSRACRRRVPSSASVKRHVGLARSRARSRRGRVRHLRLSILRACPATRASIDSACTSKPSARAIGAPAAASLRRRVRRSAPRPSARRKWRGESAEAKRAAPPVGQHVVGARDVVAERGRARRRRRTGSRRERDARRRAPRRSAPISSQVLGRERVGERERLARVAASTSANARRPRSGARRPARSSSAASARAPLRGRDRDDQAALAVLGLREHVERRRGRARASPAASPSTTSRSLGTGEAVDPDRSRELALGLLHVQVARADDHVDAARPSRCRRRARRSPARRPCGRRAPRRTAGRCRGSPGRSRRRRPAERRRRRRARPPARAVTTPITTVLG